VAEPHQVPHRRLPADPPVRKSVERSGFKFETGRDFFLEKGPRFGTFCTTGAAIKQ
jgi:hypothetical protein